MSPAPPAKPNIAIYSGGNPTSSDIGQLFGEISAGVYTTVVLWAAHVDTKGNIAMNDNPVAQDGSFVPSAQKWADLVVGLKTKPGTTITRVELSIGGDQTSFANIQTLIKNYGIGPANPLYGNLQVLKSKLNLDAVDYDDETTYDLTSSMDLAKMCVDLGMLASICPYVDQSYWVKFVLSINTYKRGTADAVYLQCYSGGSGNDPASWNRSFKPTGLTVTPGMWATHLENKQCTSSTTAGQAREQVAYWQQQAKHAGSSLAGGFMFVGTDMLDCPNGGTPADYAAAIASGLEGRMTKHARL